MRRLLPVLLFCSALLLGANQARTQYLIPGVGVEGLIAIGEQKAGAKPADWNSVAPGLDYRVVKRKGSCS
jgi:hypothetical protein